MTPTTTIPLHISIAVYEAASVVSGDGDHWMISLQSDGSTNLHRYAKPEDAAYVYRASILGNVGGKPGRGFALVSCAVPIELYKEQLLLEAVAAEGKSTARLATNLTKRIERAAASLVEDRRVISEKSAAKRAKAKAQANEHPLLAFGEGERPAFGH